MQLKGRQMIFKDVSQIGLFLINNFVLHIFFLGAESCLWCVGLLHLLTKGGPHGRVSLCVNTKEFRKSKSMFSCEELFISIYYEYLLSTYYVTITGQEFIRERGTWKNQADIKKYQMMTHHYITVVLILPPRGNWQYVEMVWIVRTRGRGCWHLVGQLAALQDVQWHPTIYIESRWDIELSGPVMPRLRNPAVAMSRDRESIRWKRPLFCKIVRI